MQRRLLQTTQRKANRRQSQPISQTSSGNNKLKVKNSGGDSKTVPISKQKKDRLIKVSQSSKNKKPPEKEQTTLLKYYGKVKRQSVQSKQKGRKKIVSYKSQQIDFNSENEQKLQVVQIQLPQQDDTVDDMNILLLSGYPMKEKDHFLKQTQLMNQKTKKQYFDGDIQSQDKQKRCTKKIRRTNSKNPESKSSGSNTISEKKNFLGSNQKATLQKSHQKLQKSIQGINASFRSIQKTNLGALSKIKKGKTGISEKSQSKQTKKGISGKQNSITVTVAGIKSCKKLIPKDLLKSISKQSNSNKKQSLSNKKVQKINQNRHKQKSPSKATSTPTLQELQRLRQQNQKYKQFLATSAFKVQDLKKQIQQHKQIRESQRGIYNFQLNNLKKQLEANEKYLGHLYSYEDPQRMPELIPDQIIVETDNQSSQALDSMNTISKISKKATGDQGGSNKIRKSSQNMRVTEGSNPSSNDNEENSMLAKTNLSMKIKDMKGDLLKEAAQLKFLSDIEKISSSEVKLSLQQSENSSGKENQANDINLASNPGLAITSKRTSNLVNNQFQNGMLLLNSIGK